MKRHNRVIGIAAALLIGTIFIQATAYAQIGPNPKTGARQARIAGLWDVEVTVANCATGAPLATFDALHKFERGGTGQVVPATNPAGLSAHMMIWSNVTDNDYLMAVKMYRFDPAGTFVGWTVLTNEITLNDEGDEYTGTGVADFYDAAGNLLGTSCPSLVGTRFTGE